MKTKYITLLSVAFLAMAGSADLHAKPVGPSKNPEARKARMEERFQKMVEELGLTADQQALLKAQQEQSRDTMQKIRDDDSLSPEQKKEKMKELRESQRGAMSQVLNEEQRKKLAAKREQMKENREAHREKRKENREQRKEGKPSA